MSDEWLRLQIYLFKYSLDILKLALLRHVDIQKKLYIFNVYNLMGLYIYIHLWNHLHSQGNRHTALHFCHPAVTSNFTSLQQKSLIFYQIWLFSLTFQLFFGCTIIVPVPHIRYHNGFNAFFCTWLILSLVIICTHSTRHMEGNQSMQGPLHLYRYDSLIEVASVDQTTWSFSILHFIYSSNLKISLPIYNFVH